MVHIATTFARLDTSGYLTSHSLEWTHHHFVCICALCCHNIRLSIAWQSLIFGQRKQNYHLFLSVDFIKKSYLLILFSSFYYFLKRFLTLVICRYLHECSAIFQNRLFTLMDLNIHFLEDQTSAMGCTWLIRVGCWLSFVVSLQDRVPQEIFRLVFQLIFNVTHTWSEIRLHTRVEKDLQ